MKKKNALKATERNKRLSNKSLSSNSKKIIKEIASKSSPTKRIAQPSIKKNTDKYRDIIENIHEFFFEVDLSGKYTLLNNAVCRALGYTRKEIIGSDGRQYVHKNDRERVFKAFNKVYKTGKPLRKIGYYITRKNGEERYIEASIHLRKDSSGKPTGFRGIVRDVTESKQAEEKLYIEKQRFRILAEQSSDIILLLNRDGIIIYENPAVEKILGFNIKERIGKNAFENIHPDDKNRVKNAFDTFLGEKEIPPRRNEVRILDIHGTLHTFESVSRHLIKDNISEGIIVNLRDITERKNTEISLSQSEEDYRTLVEQSIDGVLIIQESRIVMANQAFCVISGLPLKKIIGSNPLDFIHPEDRKKAEERIGEMLSGKQFSEGYVYRAFRSDGSLSWIELRSNLIRWKGKPAFQTILRDITELKKAAQEWQNTFDTVGDAICLLDVDQRILRCNLAMSKMFGVTKEKLLGRHCWEIVHDSRKPVPECPVIRTKSSLVREQMEFQMKERWFNVTADPILDESGSLLGLVHIVRDITERKLMEEKLRREKHRFLSLAEQSSDIIVLVNGEGVITYENPAVEKCLGFQPKERIGSSMFDLIHPDDLKIANDIFNMLNKKAQASVQRTEIRLRHKNGSWQTFEATVNNILNDKVLEGGIINLRDITERKLAEEKLRESENQYRTFFNTSRDCVYITSLNGNWVDMNDAAIELFGYSSRNELMRVKIPALYAKAEDRTKHISIIAEHGFTTDYPVDLRKKDGSIINTLITSAARHDSNGKIIGLMGTIKDITKQKQAEKSLKESELKFRTIFDSVSDGILLAQIGNRKFSTTNNKMCEMLGYTNEELIKLSISDIHPVESLPFVIDQFEKLLRKEILIAHNIPVMRKDKTVFFADVGTSPINLEGKDCIIGMFRDITEQKKAEKDLQDSEELFRYLFLYHAAVKLIIDPETGHIMDANQAALKYYGWSREQITRMTIQEINTQSPEEVKAAMEKVKTSKRYSFEFRHRRADGSVRDVEIFSSNIKVQGKDILHSVIFDITERKKAEEELQKYREHLEDLVKERTIKLEAANKELEAFSYSASHDLRAPLRTIDGFSQALLEDCEDKLNTQGKDYLTRIRKATRLMAELIEDMLTLSRITRNDMDIVNVNLTQIARSVINELEKSQPERNIKIKIADGLDVLADPRLMRIVIENLLGNAWKFTGKQAKAEIELGTTTKDGEKVFFIRDNGVGFDMEYADKLFAPFQRLHNAEEYPGTGVGLATVQRIINRHGGKVWAEGKTGEGATFYFSLND